MKKKIQSLNGIPIGVGSKVRIKKEAPNSGFVRKMEQFLGTIQTIEGFNLAIGEAVKICGFTWNLKDLEPLEENIPDPKDKEPVLFNEEELLRGVE